MQAGSQVATMSGLECHEVNIFIYRSEVEFNWIGVNFRNFFALQPSTDCVHHFCEAMSNPGWRVDPKQAFHSMPAPTFEPAGLAFQSAGPSAGIASQSAGMASKKQPVEGKVIDVDVGSKRFKVIPEPVVSSYAGGNPLCTADIRRAMQQPSCSVVSQGHNVGEHMVLYGYFNNNEKNLKNWYGAPGVGKSEVPPAGVSYISLRNSVAECLDRSTWGRKMKEYYFDRDLMFYRLIIPKESYIFLMRHKFIVEMGKWEGGKQWVHLFKTNVKSHCTYETDDGKEMFLWDGELLTKEDMEALAYEIDPCFEYPGKKLVDCSNSTTSNSKGGVWRS